MRFVLLAPALALVLLLAACGGAPTAAPRAEGSLVTLRVAGEEEYKILLTDPADIEIARKLLAGEEAPRIPNGQIVRGDPSVNEGYTWHIAPDSLEFVDMTMEVCDGLPSDVEQQILTSERFCPWSAEIIAIEE